MATKPRAVKAPIKAVATKRTVASTPEVTRKAAAKPAAKPAAKAAMKPVAKALKPVTKAAVKPVAKANARPPVKAVAKPAARRASALPVALKRAAKAVVAAALPAAGNPSLVRDSFTMPEAEYAVFASTKQRCLKAGIEIKKSELLRIGMALVGQLDVATLQTVLSGLPQLKTGRPRSE